MASYKGITFAEGYNKTFAEFKEEFGSTHIFKNIHPNEREEELKKAHKIAISKNVIKEVSTTKAENEIEVNKPELLKADGDTSGTTKKGAKDNTK